MNIRQLLLISIGLTLSSTTIIAEPQSNCQYFWTKPSVCVNSYNLPGFADIQEKQKGKVEQILHYQYDFSDEYSFGFQTSVKNFHKRSKDFGFGKKLSDSQLTFTVKNLGVNWIGNFMGTEVNMHVGENKKNKATVFFGLYREW